MNTSFSFGAMISSGYAAFKKHWKFIILASLATAAVQIALQILERGSEQGGAFLTLVASAVVILIGIIITLGWSRVILSLDRANSANFETFKTAPETWIRLIKTGIWYLAYFLMAAIVAVLPFAILTLIGILTSFDIVTIIGIILGTAAFLIVAVYFKLRYQFIYFTVLDYPDLRSKAIFKKAGEITKGSLLNLLGFGIVMGLLNLVGLVCLVIGLIITIPVTKLAQGKVYDFLKSRHETKNAAAKSE